MSPLLRRRTPRAVVVLGAAWALLFAAVCFGLRGPSVETLFGPGSRRSLDYAARPSALTPLSNAFIDRVLGPDGELPNDAVDAPGAAQHVRHSKGRISRTLIDHPRTHDESEQAYPIPSIPFTAKSDSRGATRNGDPDDCSAVGGTVWYRYTAPRDIGLVAYTIGTDHSVVLGAFERTGDGLRNVGTCDRDESGNALITFLASRARTYLFQVTAPVGGGMSRFSLDPRGTIARASVSPDGSPANADVEATHLTPDGRYVVMRSFATNLVSEAPTSCEETTSRRHIRYNVPGRVCGQIYVLDRTTGSIERVSESASGVPGNGTSKTNAVMSGDGRYVAFVSDADNLGPSDGVGFDLFVKDLRTGSVELVAAPPSTSTHHVDGNMVAGGWFMPSLSHDGRYLAFQTPAPLVSRDDNESWDVYVYDRVERSYELASVDSAEQVSTPSLQRDVRTLTGREWGRNNQYVDLTPFISQDGRYVVFRSMADSLVEDDHNQVFDTFVRDRLEGTTERVSVSSDEQEGDGPTGWRLNPTTPTISRDGRHVVFDSAANHIAGERDISNDVYVRDRAAGTTKRIGASLGDFLVENPRYPSGWHFETPHYPSISGTGRFITYSSVAYTDDLAECDGTIDGWMDCNFDVFVYDMLTDTTIPITMSEGGEDLWGAISSISDDGSTVMFHSQRGGAPLQVYLYEAPRAL